jgi:hypothetical protein
MLPRDDAAEVDQQNLAHRLDDPTMVLGNFMIHQRRIAPSCFRVPPSSTPSPVSSPRGGAFGSCPLAGRQAQTRQEEFSVFRVAEGQIARHYQRAKRA